MQININWEKINRQRYHPNETLSTLLTGLWVLKDLLNARQNFHNLTGLVGEYFMTRVTWKLLASSYG